jgi:hypothetical protein
MMRITFITLFLLASLVATAQDCDCMSEFDFTKNYYEANSPAFQKIKNTRKSYLKYLKEVKSVRRELKRSPLDCFLYLDKYIGLLKDHHSGLGYNLKRMDLTTNELIAKFIESTKYKNFRKIQIDTVNLKARLSKKEVSDVEGVYTNGGSIQVGILKKENTNDQYLGVALKETKLLATGHVLLELTELKGGEFICTYNIGILGFTPERITMKMSIKDGQMPDFGFSKVTDVQSVTELPYKFAKLNDSTNYLRLGSFDAEWVSTLDSLYSSIDRELRSAPNLIIDIRNNGGGTEQGYFNLMPYIYTRPLKVDSVLVWVTPDNIQHYERSGNNQALVDRMKKAPPNSFIPLVEKGISYWKMDSVTTYPRKIALLFNQGTASSAESMITYCMQSDKVITIGENSGGYMGYGNVMTQTTPCGNFNLRCTTTKYHFNARYEYIGIEPMFKAKDSDDWVSLAETLLVTKK